MVTIRDSFADPSVVSNDGRSFPLSDSREGASSEVPEARASRVRERFHGDIMVSLSFCAFARDAWTITEMGAGDDPAPGRRENRTGIERAIERATGVARRTPAPRPPLCVDRVRLPINIRSSSRVNRFESSHRGVAVESTNSPRVPLNPSHRHRRSTRARSPSVVSFRGLSVRPVRPFRPHRRRWSSPFLVSSSPRFLLLVFLLASPRFRVPGALVVATSGFSFVRLGGRGARFYES